MNIKVRISAIEKQSLNRPEGYKEEMLSNGTIDGEFVVYEKSMYQRLFFKYRNQNYNVPPCPSCGNKNSSAPMVNSSSISGLGDLVYKVANPIARGIDKVLGTDIEHCGGCKKRREKLNKILPL